MRDRETIATYDQVAELYSEFVEDFWDKFPDDVLETFQKSVPGNRVLSLGSGPGQDTLLLRQYGLDAVALDASASMTMLSKSRNIPTVQADILQLPVAAGSLDGVWAYTSLIHVDRRYLGFALNQIWESLIPGGALGLGFIEGKGEETKPFSADIPGNVTFRYYEDRSVRSQLHLAGFKIVHASTYTPRQRNYLNYVAQKI